MTERERIDRGIDANRSVWASGKAPYAPLPALADDVECDVAVVGGGFTGVSTALQLATRAKGCKVVLLEARELATGASGRNGGLVLNWVNGVEAKDPANAKRVYEATREGIDLIADTIAEHRLPVAFRREGTFDVVTDPKRAEAAREDVVRLAAAGVPLQFLGREELAEHIDLEGAWGATYDPSTGQLDGVDYLRALRPVLLAKGVAVHEETPVTRIEVGKAPVLHTPGGVVRARAVVLATNAYTPNLGFLRSGIVPLHSHVLATEPLDPSAWRAIGWKQGAGFSDDLDRIAYASMTARGELVFGGGSNASYGYVFGGGTAFTAPADAAFRAVHASFLKYFPKAKDVPIAHRWTGTIDVSATRICTMGVMGDHRNVYYAAGFSGHGVTLANLAGRVLTDMYLGEDARWHDLPFFQQKLVPMPPEPLRWLGYHVYTRLTGKSPRRRA